MSVKGIIMFLGTNNIRLERKILIILDFENGFLPSYLPQCTCLACSCLGVRRPLRLALDLIIENQRFFVIVSKTKSNKVSLYRYSVSIYLNTKGHDGGKEVKNPRSLLEDAVVIDH